MTKLSGPMLAPANGQAPDSAVVLLHGYGSDGNDLIGLAPHWQGLLPGALFVSPNAAQALGMGGYQWFAIDWAGDRLASRQTGVIAARPVLLISSMTSGARPASGRSGPSWPGSARAR